ncbi:hypothetical protein GIX91_12995 [Staphylococcus saprophyticus]|nr:hypothetical protein [Staphylococcus saprophyticus]
MSQLLKYYGFSGYIKYVNANSFIVEVLPEDKAHNRKSLTVLNRSDGELI